MTSLAFLLLLGAAVKFADAVTPEQGNAIARSMNSLMTKTLASGSMAKMADELFADEIEWVWSGPQEGKGKKEAFVAEFANTWGAIVSAFLPASLVHTVTDPVAKKISFISDVTINLNGKGKVPDCYVTLPTLWVLTVNEELKVTRWEGMWDPADPTMVACMGKVQAAIKEDL